MDKDFVNPLKTGKPLLFAHRGSRLLAPENTFAAFDLGLAARADVLEIDIRISRDDEIIVIHDQSVERTTNGRGLVSEHTLSRLKKFNAGHGFISTFGESFAHRKIRLPTLLELYEAYPNVIVNIDIKDTRRHAARLLAQAIEKANAEHRTVVASFHGNILRYFRLIAPNVATSATFSEVLGLYFSSQMTPAKTDSAQKVLQIPTHYKMIPLNHKRFIDCIHRGNGLVNYWTINDPISIRDLLKRGADGIITDRPDLALEIFQEFGFK